MKKLHKLLAVSSLALAVSAGANAATTDNLTITATVPVALNVAVTAAAGNTFTLTSGVTYDAKVADVGYDGNANFELRASSGNSGVLTDGTNNIPYSFAAADLGNCVSFATCPLDTYDLSTGMKVIHSGVGVENGTKEVFIEVNSVDFAFSPAGDYQDTVTFDIVAI